MGGWGNQVTRVTKGAVDCDFDQMGPRALRKRDGTGIERVAPPRVALTLHPDGSAANRSRQVASQDAPRAIKTAGFMISVTNAIMREIRSVLN